VGIDSELKPTKVGDGKVGYLKLTGSVTSLDGQKNVTRTIRQEVSSAEDAERVGSALAREMINTGAKEILDDINKDRERRVKEAKKEDDGKAEVEGNDATSA
jgi:hydroxymethylbilane synthase